MLVNFAIKERFSLSDTMAGHSVSVVTRQDILFHSKICVCRSGLLQTDETDESLVTDIFKILSMRSYIIIIIVLIPLGLVLSYNDFDQCYDYSKSRLNSYVLIF